MFSQCHLLSLPVGVTEMGFQHPKNVATWYQHNVFVYDHGPRRGTKKRIPFGVRHVRNALPHEQQLITTLQAEEELNAVEGLITSIDSMLKSMEDGGIVESAYDTAWLALIKDVNGNNAPLFPCCLQWIANHQLEDGSWGNSSFFVAYDRIINTLACVVALKSWNVHLEKLDRGITFIKENIYKLEDDSEEHMPVGFEVAFPSILEMAKKLDIEIIEDSSLLRKTYEKRDLKLNKIPNDILHTISTPLLYTLEGMMKYDLDWEKLIKLQFEDGSFCTSPAATAFAFMQTNDQKCLSYLKNLVQRYQNGGVPNTYPVDLFERMWAVDRLQRLGISRHFQAEIKNCLGYVYRYWTENGICWSRNSKVQDVDDTAMGFRLLRLHGFRVSPNVFRQFEKGGEFIAIAGQTSQAVTGTYNLLRASQLMFPEESILQRAKSFSYKYLKEQQTSNQLLDKWFIAKDLPGEVGYALDVPWYANLPRVEARFYVEQYGGKDDVWIGKTLYRMPYVNNDKYLDLAKRDFENCQAQHRLEWDTIQKWYASSCFLGFGVSREELLLSYFLAAASIFEPERSDERMAWAKTNVLIKIISSYFNDETTCAAVKMAFINKLNDRNKSAILIEPNETIDELVGTVMKTINHQAKGIEIHQRLYDAWGKWMTALYEEGNGYLGEAELLLQTIYYYDGKPFTLKDGQQHLLHVTNNICNKIRHFQDQNTDEEQKLAVTSPEIEKGMQELVHLVYQNASDESNEEAYLKQTCLTIAKSFYYTAYFDSKTIDSHISKIFFEKMI